MLRKIISVATVALFLLTASLPLWGRILPGADREANENRARAKFPSGDNITEFPKKFEAWFDDNFAYRALMADIYNNIIVSSGAEIINNVIIGKDGWLYYAADGSLEDIKREARYSDAELEYICARQQECADYLEKLGIGYYLVICPDKHTIYPEYLPDDLADIPGESRFDALAAALSENTTVNFIDTREAVMAEKQNGRAFFKIDTHWNGRGAFAGYTELIERIAEDYPVRVITRADCDLTITENWLGGDMAIFLGREDELTDTMYIYAVKDSDLIRLETRYAETSPDPERPIVALENRARPDLPTAVIFRDSFCRMMYPQLADSFSKVTFVWSTSVMNSVVKNEKPDIVIMEYVERYSGMMGQGMDIPEPKIAEYVDGDPLPEQGASIFSYVDSLDTSRYIGTVNGWAFYAGRDALKGEKHIALQKGDEIVYLETATVYRPDVTSAYYGDANEPNVDNAGFSAWFDKTALSSGTWKLIVVIDDGENAVYKDLKKFVNIK